MTTPQQDERGDVAAVARRLAVVRETMSAAGDVAGQVTVIAVTKGFGPWAVVAAQAVGLGDIGENYADDLIAKSAVAPALRRHFIGRLQSNKIRPLAGSVDVWQSVDRLKLVELIARYDPGATIMVQVDISAEASKGGCPASEAGSLVGAAREAGLDVIGLMGVAAVASEEIVAGQFASLRSLVDELGLEHCSMGMSGDLALAVQQGATMVRLGTALFGPRPR
jgi:uncharacterized pyridoxal phosphate-containing UPF0001 family protein